MPKISQEIPPVSSSETDLIVATLGSQKALAPSTIVESTPQHSSSVFNSATNTLDEVSVGQQNHSLSVREGFLTKLAQPCLEVVTEQLKMFDNYKLHLSAGFSTLEQNPHGTGTIRNGFAFKVNIDKDDHVNPVANLGLWTSGAYDQLLCALEENQQFPPYQNQAIEQAGRNATSEELDDDDLLDNAEGGIDVDRNATLEELDDDDLLDNAEGGIDVDNRPLITYADIDSLDDSDGISNNLPSPILAQERKYGTPLNNRVLNIFFESLAFLVFQSWNTLMITEALGHPMPHWMKFVANRTFYISVATLSSILIFSFVLENTYTNIKRAVLAGKINNDSGFCSRLKEGVFGIETFVSAMAILTPIAAPVLFCTTWQLCTNKITPRLIFFSSILALSVAIFCIAYIADLVARRSKHTVPAGKWTISESSSLNINLRLYDGAKLEDHKENSPLLFRTSIRACKSLIRGSWAVLSCALSIIAYTVYKSSKGVRDTMRVFITTLIDVDIEQVKQPITIDIQLQAASSLDPDSARDAEEQTTKVTGPIPRSVDDSETKSIVRSESVGDLIDIGLEDNEVHIVLDSTSNQPSSVTSLHFN